MQSMTFTFFFVACFAFYTQGAHYDCYNHPSPIHNRRRLTPVNCDMVSLGQVNLVSKNNLNSIVSGNDNTPKMVQVNLNCQASGGICKKVNEAFTKASSYLENVIIFKEPIVVNASFYSFCKIAQECITNNLITLGQAGAARSIALTDSDDGKRRLYPQALVKQLNLKKQPKFSKVDIIAEFNSDANFWFEGMGDLKDDQSDFLLVISHELIHGLGFSSSYSDYFNEVPASITPYPEIFMDESNGEIRFAGFTENIFDKYIVQSDGGNSLTSEFVDKMNKFGNSDKVYKTQNQLESEISESQVFDYGSKLMQLSTVPGSLSFKTNNNSVVLETSLKPFTSLSSLSHVDYKKYTNSKDFLMRYKTDTGDKLSNIVGKLGQWDTAPYGPELISILEKMGYATNNNPNPQITAKFSSSLKNSLYTLLALCTIVKHVL